MAILLLPFVYRNAQLISMLTQTTIYVCFLPAALPVSSLTTPPTLASSFALLLRTPLETVLHVSALNFAPTEPMLTLSPASVLLLVRVLGCSRIHQVTDA